MRLLGMRYILSRDAFFGLSHVIYRACGSWFWTSRGRNSPEGPFRSAREAARHLSRQGENYE